MKTTVNARAREKLRATGAILFVLLLFGPCIAWGHGFDLSMSSTAWTGVSVTSEESQLDSSGTSANINTLFYEDFSSTSATSPTGGSYYSVIHGFADLVGGNYSSPPAAYFTATFNIISPLYFSDGSGGATASGAMLASAGTTIEMYDNYYSSFSGPEYPGSSPGYISISGSTPFAAGFQTSMDNPHEIAKELFLAPNSTQTYGEYGFAFDVTLTLGDGTTIVTPPLVDVFATSSGNNDFTAAPTTANSGPQQDAATLSIYYAATAAGNAVIGNTSSWSGNTNSSWATASNWENGIVPGSTTGTTSNDTVVFCLNPANSVATIDPGRNVQTILFELGSYPTYGSTGVGTLTLGTSNGNALLLTNGGSIQVTSTVPNPEVVNAPLVLEGANALYTFNTDSLTTSATLSFGGSITGGAAGNTVLTLGGDNTGNNTISGAIGNGSATSLALLESGTCTWILSGPNSYTGGTTVNQGTLTVTSTGTLGAATNPLTITTVAGFDSATVNINGNQSVGNLSGTIYGAVLGSTGALNIAAGSSLTVNQTASTTFGATLDIADGTTATFGAFTLQGTLQGSGTLEMDAAPTLGDQSQINVNGGTLRFNVSSGPATIGSGVVVNVASTATLQLAGSVAALSDGGTANIVNNGSTASHGGLLVTGTNQVVGVISGNASASGPTTYSGDTVVGDGSNAASLTATQILQNSLTINAGSTVTIAPAGSGSPNVGASDAAAGAAAASSATTAASGTGNSDALAAIQAAIASGSITATTGQVLENRIAAIERLAVSDPALNADLLEDRVLAEIPGVDWPADESANLLNSDGSASGIGGAFEFGGVAGNGAAPVPEPPALILAIIAGLAVVGTLRVPWGRRSALRTTWRRRHTECACYFRASILNESKNRSTSGE